MAALLPSTPTNLADAGGRLYLSDAEAWLVKARDPQAPVSDPPNAASESPER